MNRIRLLIEHVRVTFQLALAELRDLERARKAAR